jgi:hypothetical protein
LQPGLSKLSFLLYSVVALLIQVPQPPPGTYYIVNSARASDGDQLAATFQANGPYVNVTAMDGLKTQQVWLDTSSHILLFISLDFVVDHHSWPAIYNTC